MTIFETAINDIFNHKDFLEDCFIAGTAYKCICSTMQDGIVSSEEGLVDDVGFTIDLKLPIDRMPARGDKVRFRNENFKVLNVTYDSANASVKIHLQGVSKG